MKPYRGKALDPEIASTVQDLRSHGFQTSYSCQGGTGHQFVHPTVDVIAPFEQRTQIRVRLGLWAQQAGRFARFHYVRHTPLGHLRKPHKWVWRITFEKDVPQMKNRLMVMIDSYDFNTVKAALIELAAEHPLHISISGTLEQCLACGDKITTLLAPVVPTFTFGVGSDLMQQAPADSMQYAIKIKMTDGDSIKLHDFGYRGKNGH